MDAESASTLDAHRTVRMSSGSAGFSTTRPRNFPQAREPGINNDFHTVIPSCGCVVAGQRKRQATLDGVDEIFPHLCINVWTNVLNAASVTFRAREFSGNTRVETVTRRRTAGVPGKNASVGVLLRADARGELGDLVVNGAALGHELADLLVGVHHGGVVAAAELLPDFR